MVVRSQDFSQLYRSAFAETDPERKVALLCEVKKAIERWEQMLQTTHHSVENPLPARSESGRRFLKTA